MLSLLRVFFKTYLSSLGWNAYDIVEAEPFLVHKLKLPPLDTPLEREVLNAVHDPRSIRSMRSIRSTDCSVISQSGRPVQDSFQDHQSQLDVGNVCDLFSFTIYFTVCSSRRGQKEVIFAKTAEAYFSCAQDVKLYSCLIIKAVSQLLPNYESSTWDAKTRKLLSYQIVISGKIQYFQTFFSEAYSLKEFCHFSMHA